MVFLNKNNIIGAISVVVAVAVGKFFAAGAFDRGTTVAEMEALLLSSPAAPTYIAIKENFPEDATDWLNQIVALDKKLPTGTTGVDEAIEIGAALRQKHAPSLQFAPDKGLRDIMVWQVKVHELFENQPDACARFLIQGPAALDSKERDQIIPLLDEPPAMFRLARIAQSAPVHRRAATAEDWENFYSAYVGAGYSPEEFDLVITPDPQHPQLCNAFLGFFRTLRDGDFIGAEQIRSEVVPSLMAS